MNALVTLHHLNPSMGPVERVAVALFAERTARGLLSDTDHLVSVHRDWQATHEGVRADFLKLSTEILQAAAVDPCLLRWCDWPQCIAHYDASTGPAERGWKGSHGWLLCPSHSGLGHHPKYEFAQSMTVLLATCACGQQEEVRPQNQAAVMGWWRGHVAQLSEVAR